MLVLLFRFSKWMIVSVENEWFNLLLLTICVLEPLLNICLGLVTVFRKYKWNMKYFFVDTL